jgi:hypothetical protein
MHLNNQISLSVVLRFILFSFIGCSKQERHEAYVAKIENSILTL